MKEEELFAAFGLLEAVEVEAMTIDTDREFGGGSTMVRRDHDTGCLIWVGSLTQSGYATARSGRDHVAIHRLIFEITHRRLRAGELVRHIIECPNRNCIEPKHLMAGSHADNMADMRERVARGLPATTPPRRQQFNARRRDAIRRSIPYTGDPPLPPPIYPPVAEVIHTLSTRSSVRELDTYPQPPRVRDEGDETLGENDERRRRLGEDD